MFTKLRPLLALLPALFAVYSYAQAPIVTYAGPQKFIKDTTITPLAPNISSPINFSSGIVNPNGLAVDAAGNVYVAGAGSNQVYKVPAGGGTAVAIGSGFLFPLDVAVDPAGNVYVADFANGKLKKIPAGGGAPIVITSAEPNIGNVAVDKAGNIYTTDLFNSDIVYKIPAGGGAQVAIGSGFKNPFGLAVDTAGNIYVADQGNNAVKKMPAGGGAPVTIGIGFLSPQDVAVDAAGNVYVADVGNQAIKEILAGSGATITVASFNSSSSLAVNAAGDVFLSGNDAIKEFKPITSFAISPALPTGLSFDTATGVISGTPTALIAPTKFTITAHYNTGNAIATVNIRVVQAPPIQVSTVTGAISACAGEPSENPHLERFSVSGNSLSANITVTAPTGFQVSLAPGGTYGNSLTLPQSGGNVNATTIFVRSAAGAAGNIFGNVSITSTGSPSQNVPVTGTVNSTPSLNPVANQTVPYNTATAPVNFTGPGGVSWTNNTPSIGLAASGSGNIPSFTGLNTGTTPVTATITATPVSAGLLYVSNAGTFSVSVINAATNAIIDTIHLPNIGLGTIIPSPDGSRMYVAGGDAIEVINTTTNTLIANIPVVTPETIALSPDGSRLYVTNSTQANVTVINTANNLVAATIPVGADPIGLIVSPDGSKVYVANSGSNTISVINAATNTVTGTLTSGQNPYALTITHDGNTLYVTNNGQGSHVSVIDIASGTTVATLPITFGRGITITPDGSRVYVAGDFSVSVINTATNQLVTTIQEDNISGGIIVSPDGTRVYSTNYGISGSVSVINTATNTIISTVTVGGSPNGVAYTYAGGTSCGGAPVSFNITVNPASANVNLSNLTINSGTLSPVFSAGTTSYTASVTNTTASISVTPTAADSTSTIKINDTPVQSGTASAAIPLTVGNNVINVIVTAQNGTTKTTYTINVTRDAAGTDNALLTKLTTNSGVPLTQVSGPDYRDYTLTLPSSPASITITPTTQNAAATVTVNGVPVASGTASQPIPLNFGNTIINTVVTAADGITTKTYSITVTRPASSNALLTKITTNSGVALTQVSGPDYKDYAITVPNTLTSITVTPTTQDATASVTVNGTPVTSGTASPAMSLAVGTTIINTVVTAQDGATTKTYSIAVTRASSSNANLASLVTNDGDFSPAFSKDTLTYRLSVAYTIRNIYITPTVADTTATVTVNLNPVTSGRQSLPNYLNIGKDTIRTTVHAQDGTTKTYTLIVSRAASTNALLNSIKTTPTETLTSVSGPSYRNYTASVPSSQTSIQVTSVTQDTTATLKVNGTSVASGALSPAIPLAVGANVINTVVTAGDGVTTKTYTITVTRPSNNAVLTKIATNSGVALTPVSGPDYKDYTINVPNATASITVTPTTQDAMATVKVNGVTVASGTASASIPLQVGNTVITTVVTAQDGVTTKTYGITVTRAAMFALYLPKDSVATDGLTVHPGITPNGDGINDIFTIDGISAYPDNKVIIMGRSGAVVFEATGYDNQTKFFDGHSNKNGSLQLPGTYFYSLEYKVDGKSKVKTGFIVLKY